MMKGWGGAKMKILDNAGNKFQASLPLAGLKNEGRLAHKWSFLLEREAIATQ